MTEPGDLQRVILDLEPNSDTVRGWVSFSDDAAQPFHGWLELSAHLERMRPRPDDEL